MAAITTMSALEVAARLDGIALFRAVEEAELLRLGGHCRGRYAPRYARRERLGLWRQPRPRNRAGFGGLRGCYGPAWIRTRDQRIMSPLL